VGFTPRHEATQKLFYALQQLGVLERLHDKVFDAIHRQSRAMVSEEDQVRFVTAQGVDGARFREALGSAWVAARMKAATQLSDDYDIDGVPTLGIHGRFMTSPAMTSSRQRTLAVADALIQRCREGR
jgi:thiol:disulfide interchange protein DsbA